MKAQQTTPKDCKLYVKIWTLKDKEPMFRAKEPDQHLVEIWLKLESSSINVRTDIFLEETKALAHYATVKRQLGYE